MVSFEARDYREAIEALQLSLDEQRNPLTPSFRKEVQKLLKRAKRYVGYIEFDLEPAATTISIDGHQRELVDGKLIVNPRELELVASAKGYKTIERVVRVESGETLTLQLKLEPIESIAGEADIPQTSEVGFSTKGSSPIDENNIYKSWQSSDLLPWIIVVGSSAATVAGGVMFGLGLNDISEVENAKMGTFYREIKQPNERAPIFTTVGAVLFGVGIAGATTGIILLSVSDDQEVTTLSLTADGILVRGIL